MGGIRLTLLELHGDIKLGSTSLGIGSEDESTTGTGASVERAASEDESSATSGIGVLVGLTFLTILGLAVRKRFSGDSDELLEQPVELAESDDI